MLRRMFVLSPHLGLLEIADRTDSLRRLWVLKNTILEFFRRLNVSWQRSYEVTLKIIRGTLIATFVAVVISDLAECQPFSHYWQVLPDPGGRCRQGYAQLLTLAVCNVLTDLLLVIFPIPIILRSGLTVKRKAELILLFSLSLIVVATTIYRVPHIIEDHGSQRSRSLYASVELLFATAAANTLVLGSFVRDRGVKKMKFKYGSVAAGSVDRSSASESRRPTLNKHWGSLEDLARDTGFGVQPELQKVDSPTNRRFYMPTPVTSMPDGMDTWRFSDQTQVSVAQSHDPLAGREQQSARRDSSNRRVTFFDVGGLLDDQDPGRRDSHTSTSDPSSPQSIPAPTIPASARGFRRGSTAFLQDIGGLFSSPTPKPDLPKPKEAAESAESPRTRRQSLARSFSASAYPAATGNAELELMDPGGLLNEDQHE